MIYSISGEIIKKLPNQVIIQQGGFGIEVTITRPTYEAIGNTSDECLLYTYLHVREDILMLYGFANLDEKELFLKLISVSKIGPKKVLNILSGVSSNDLKKFIVQEKIELLKRLPGIGDKTARRIILELKDKFTEKELSELTSTSALSETYKTVAKESITALESLGFKSNQV
ncbi:MAG: Holliday junction branch migration protein RuvA, partial [Candidatus Marinimicrobia bacterium]|nr:Holliday junction branch migration protein RuvA [Candidatus Neomarinimicrobiota bacterium]